MTTPPAKVEAAYQVPYHDFLGQDHIWPRVGDDKAQWSDEYKRGTAPGQGGSNDESTRSPLGHEETP